MSSLTNINNNSSVVNVGRTTPVSPGQQPAAKSIPVVLATDQTAIPVVEQNKIQSEVALSLLGIPRAEVALGIFADVNTYDVNPTEWSANPSEYTTGHGIKHLPEEAGALIQAPKDEVAVLTSKRFFRYQPGRVSAATFGIKSTISPGAVNPSVPTTDEYDLNPSIRKFGIFDKFDGYYWDVIKNGADDNFSVVRRTQSLLKYVPVPFGNAADQQVNDHAIAGKAPDSNAEDPNAYPAEYNALLENRFKLARAVVDEKIVKCKRDVGYFLDGVGYDIALGTNYNAVFLGIAETNSVDLSQNIYDTIDATKTSVVALSAVANDATALARANSFFTEVSNIVKNDRTVASAITFTDPTGASTSRLAIKDRIINNIDFIIAEVNARVATTYPSNNHNVSKCDRDIKYALYSYVYDMLYGGSSATYDNAKFFLYFDGDQDNDPPSILSAHKVATVYAYDQLKIIVLQIIQNQSVSVSVNNTSGLSQYTGSGQVDAGDIEALTTLVDYIPRVIESGITSLNSRTKTYPSVVWAADPLEAAKTAIENNKTSIINTVAPGGYTQEDLKCIRDLTYILEGLGFDLVLGTNYNALFLGHAEHNSLDFSQSVIDKINAAKAKVLLLGDVADSSNAQTRVNNFFTTMLSIAAGGVAPTVTWPASKPSSTSTNQLNAKNQLQANKAFIQAEINAWVNVTYPTHNHDETKCTRDTGYAVDAFSYDIYYGGNSATYDVAKFFWFNGIEQTSAEHKTQTIAAYDHLRVIIGNIVQGLDVIPSTGNTVAQVKSGSNASLDESVILQEELAQILINVIGSGLSSLPNEKILPSTTWATVEYQDAKADLDDPLTGMTSIITDLIPGGVYSTHDQKCLRDMDFAIDAYLYDLKWSGNGYSAVNASNYIGAVAANLASSEVYIHNSLRDKIIALFESITVNNPASTRITNLAAITTAAVNNTASERVNAYYTTLLNIAQTSAATTVVFPIPLSLNATTSQVAVKKQLQANKAFIAAEINAWVVTQGYSHSGTAVTKCTRDVGYVVDALTYDLLYGGNSAMHAVCSFFWFNGIDQSNATLKARTVAAYGRLKIILGQIIQNVSVSVSSGNALTQTKTGDKATDGDKTKLQDLVQALANVIGAADSVAAAAALNLAIPNKTYPSISWVSTPVQTAAKAIIESSTSIINTIVTGSTTNDLKCIRDLGYILSGAAYDTAIGTNYNAVFYGHAEDNSVDTIATNGTVYNAIVQSKTNVLALSAVSGQPIVTTTASASVTNFYTELLKIINGGAASTVTYTAPSSASLSQLGVLNQLQSNKAFIQAEVNAWIDDPLQGSYGHTTTSRTKCTRDVGYLIDAIIYDLLYGGNSATHAVASFFWFNGVDQSGTTFHDQTIAAYNYLSTIIGSIVKGIEISKTTSGNNLTQLTSGNTANDSDANTVIDLVQMLSDVIAGGIGTIPAKILPTTIQSAATLQSAYGSIIGAKSGIISALVTGTTTEDDKCRRDLGYFLDGVAYDVVLGTNYNAVFLGHAESNSVSITTNVKNLITASRDILLRLPALTSISWGNAAAIQTVLTAKKYFLAYSVSTKDASGTAITYSVPTPLPAGYTSERYAAELKYKCQRDVRYVVEGYLRDLQYGGNMGTVYNAKKYRSNGELIIFSQTTGGVVSEISRHTYLRTLITNILSQYGLSTYINKFTTLANLIVGNFSLEYTGPGEYGKAGQFGDLCILRDNLIMTHAAVFDPSLLKPRKNVLVEIDAANNTLTATEGEFISGQYINFYGDSTGNNAAGLVAGKLYKVVEVKGPKGNTIVLTDPKLNDDTAIVDLQPSVTDVYINPNVPFIFPDVYYTGPTPDDSINPINANGQFPYGYSSNNVLPVAGDDVKMVGFIDTAINVATSASAFKAQLDALNLRYNNWVKENVDPQYYAVYEYRVPRSRFSTDHLNGKTDNLIYSDIATGADGTKVFPGQPVKDTEGAITTKTSAWNFDFGKVTMLKIEFSWYGAVGALFLAYVPVGNGDARWVRVHHLRCSNQFKIPSLGNATLPITYLVYGGGSVNKLGIEDTTDKGYQSESSHIVKYGASYYIDGGDRGTVRLYSYSNDTPVSAYGSKFELGSLSTDTDTLGRYINVSTVSGLPSDLTFFMNSKLVTSSNEDQNIEITWIDQTAKKLYLNRDADLVSNTGLVLISSRPSIVFGLKAKENILNLSGVGIRNRVQVYPTKLSTANLGTVPVKMKILKTPYFQPKVTTSGTFTLSTSYTITAAGLPLPTASSTYLTKDDEFVYGWFKANVGTVFGKLYKNNGLYYFTLLQTFSIPVVLSIDAPFLKEGRFNFQGGTITGESESRVEKERLSSVYISTQIQCPVPKTGVEVASFFLKPGSDQFDLLSYFDYNKDYLSFPLTNQIESLYLATDKSQLASAAATEINSSLTWEEQ